MSKRRIRKNDNQNNKERKPRKQTSLKYTQRPKHTQKLKYKNSSEPLSF